MHGNNCKNKRVIPSDVGRELHFGHQSDPDGWDTVTVRDPIDVPLGGLISIKTKQS